jgi:hypothetical protein
MAGGMLLVTDAIKVVVNAAGMRSVVLRGFLAYLSLTWFGVSYDLAPQGCLQRVGSYLMYGKPPNPSLDSAVAGIVERMRPGFETDYIMLDTLGSGLAANGEGGLDLALSHISRVGISQHVKYEKVTLNRAA